KHENFETHVQSEEECLLPPRAMRHQQCHRRCHSEQCNKRSGLDPLFISETPKEGSTSYALLDVVKRQVRVSQWGLLVIFYWLERVLLAVVILKPLPAARRGNSGRLRNRRCNWRN